MSTYTVQHDPETGKTTGVVWGGATFVPKNMANSDWRDFLAWNEAQQIPLSLADGAPTARKPRPVLSIYQDLIALTNAQKLNVWNYLMGVAPVASPMPLTQDAGPMGGLMFTLWRRTLNEPTLPVVTLADMKAQVAALYAYDNPAAFVTPAWDATVNVAGDQLV